MSENLKPWNDPKDFQATIHSLPDEDQNWAGIARAYEERGFPTSRDTMRRTGEKHGIYPNRYLSQSNPADRAKIKDLEREITRLRKESLIQLEAEKSKPREVDPEEVVTLKKQIVRLKDSLDSARRTEKHLVRNDNIIEVVSEMIDSVIGNYTAPNFDPPPSLGDPSGGNLSWVGVMCDQHFGKNVDPATVGGVNNYNPVICALRSQEYVDINRKLIRLMRHEHNVSEGVLVLNGDPINNDHGLHPEDATDVYRVVRQVMDGACLQAQVALELAREFETFRIICSGADNHGRGTRKVPTSATATDTSFTTLYYDKIADMLHGRGNISVSIERSYQALFSVQGYSFAASHGHHIRGGGGAAGIPILGLKREHDAAIQKSIALIKAYDWSKCATDADMLKAIASIVDYTIVSHFHSAHTYDMGIGDVRVAPSLVGTDTYVLDSLKRISRAAQISFFVHEDHGIINDCRIYLDHIQKEGPTRYKWGSLVDGKPTAQVWQEWLSEN